MSISRQQRTVTEYHGIYLVPNTGRRVKQALPGIAYRIATVTAALFLAMTVC